MRYAAALAILLLAIAPVGAQDPKDPKAAAQQKVDQKKIDEAIDRGAKWLLDQGQGPHKFDHNRTTELAYDELILLTLIHAGCDYNHKVFKVLLQKAETNPLKRNYRVVVTAMALNLLDPQKYQNRIADCGQFLADNQCSNGQWSYGEEVKLPDRPKPPEDVATSGGNKPPNAGGTSDTPTPSKPPKPLPRIHIGPRGKGPESGDNSNSQYAALGIRACVEAGCDFDRGLIQKAAEWWELCFSKEGGWGYVDSGVFSRDKFTVYGDDPYGSMTAGGIGSLCIYRWILKMDWKRDKFVSAGLDWMGKNLTFPSNPKKGFRWVYYWIYAIERAGMLYGTEKMGSHEWYPEGVDFLLKAQKENGSWEGPERAPISDTCFAILFLRRATKPLPPVATGDHRK